MDNAASGDMLASTYDPQGTVAAAGGIPDYVSSNGSKPVQVYVNLSATWSGTGPYTQTITVPGVTANSEVSFRPNAAQLQQLIDDGVQALYVENNNGTCTAVAVGAAPSVAMKIQCIMTDVEQTIDFGASIVFSSANPFELETKDSDKNWDGTIEYSTDGNVWRTWDGVEVLSADKPTQSYDKYVLGLRGINNTYLTFGSDSTSFRFVTGSQIYCDGNCEALLDYQTVEAGNHIDISTYSNCFAYLFYGCTELVSAPMLPSIELGTNSYKAMFGGCTSLLVPPLLPATILGYGCYEIMFSGCTVLAKLPELPVTTLPDRCYRRMFYNCRSIKLSDSQTGEYQHEFRIPKIGTVTTYGSLALADMFTGTGGTFTGTPSINTTYYLSTSNSVVS